MQQNEPSRRRPAARIPQKSRIVRGPDFTEFVAAALKGSTSTVGFTVPTFGRDEVTVSVLLTEVRYLDPSGTAFIFKGTYQGRVVEGFYNPRPDAPADNRGRLEFI